MARCENPVDQYVPRGYDYKCVTMRCGDTGIDGLPLECGECAERRGDGPPPGFCEHGVYILTDYDIPCGRCEFGDD